MPNPNVGNLKFLEMSAWANELSPTRLFDCEDRDIGGFWDFRFGFRLTIFVAKLPSELRLNTREFDSFIEFEFTILFIFNQYEII